MTEFDYKPINIPTGVSDFDSIINGGLPAGSVIMLLGDVGAGQYEYALTSAAKLTLVREQPEMARYLMGQLKNNGTYIPKEIAYCTFTKCQEDILGEIHRSFNVDYYNAIKDHVIFKDFSRIYYKNSLVPTNWTHADDDLHPFLKKSEPTSESLLSGLVSFLDERAAGNLIIIDSLTDLVLSKSIDIKDLVSTLRALQRISKKWGGIIYLMLTHGVLDPREELMLIDSVDGVIQFEWSKSSKSLKRTRYMYIKKFMALMPHLGNQKIARFVTDINTHEGFTVSNVEMI